MLVPERLQGELRRDFAERRDSGQPAVSAANREVARTLLFKSVAGLPRLATAGQADAGHDIGSRPALVNDWSPPVHIVCGSRQVFCYCRARSRPIRKLQADGIEIAGIQQARRSVH